MTRSDRSCDQLLVPGSHSAEADEEEEEEEGEFQVQRSNRCLQAVEGAPRLWEAELAVHCVVVSVQRCRPRRAAPTSLLESVRLGVVFGAVKEWCPRLVFLQDELRVSHEVMDGASGFGFLEAFVQGATERIHHFDCPQEEMQQQQQQQKWWEWN